MQMLFRFEVCRELERLRLVLRFMLRSDPNCVFKTSKTLAFLNFINV